MHPFRSSSKDGHTAKLKRMTEGYGSADPVANVSAPTNKYKQEGGEDAVSFGANDTMAKARGDRPAKKPQANDVATLKRGGKAVAKPKHRAWGGMMNGAGGIAASPGPASAPVMGGASVRPTVVPSGGAVAASPGPGAASVVPQGSGTMRGIGMMKKGGAVNRARGGRTKKGATNVTVVVAPQAPQNPAGANPALVKPPIPPAMPPGPPPGGPPGAGGAPTGPIPPGLPPPGMMPPRASGGRVGTLSDQGLSAPSSTREIPGIKAKGSKVTGYDAGALSGDGRLQKIANYGRKESHRKGQVV
jgi:hypothetical protein